MPGAGAIHPICFLPKRPFLKDLETVCSLPEAAIPTDLVYNPMRIGGGPPRSLTHLQIGDFGYMWVQGQNRIEAHEQHAFHRVSLSFWEREQSVNH